MRYNDDNDNDDDDVLEGSRRLPSSISLESGI